MNANLRNVGKELPWAVLLVTSLWLGALLLRRVQLMLAVDYERMAFAYLAFSVTAVPCAFGVLLGLPALFERWDTHSGFNWPKLLIQGPPALALGIPTFLVVGLLNIQLNWAYLPWEAVKYQPPGFMVYLASAWFGMVLVDSFKGFRRADGNISEPLLKNCPLQ